MIEETVISDASFELSEPEQQLIGDYVNNLYSIAEKQTQNLRNFSRLSESISMTVSNKAIAEKYLFDVYSRAENSHLLMSRKDSDEDDDIDNFSDFPAPNIVITEDKTQFSVTKHLQGIQQKGYENAFSHRLKLRSNLTEKARAMSAKGDRNRLEEKPKPFEEVKEKKQEKVPKKPKTKLSEQDYFQILIKGSFPDQNKDAKDKNEADKSAEIKENLDKSKNKKPLKQISHKQNPPKPNPPMILSKPPSPNKKMQKPKILNPSINTLPIQIKPKIEPKPLPPLKIPKPSHKKAWVSTLPPTIGHEIRGNLEGLPNYDEEKFCIYSVFRTTILDSVIRESAKEVLQDIMREKKERKEKIRLKRELKSQDQIRTQDYGQYQAESNIDQKYMDYNFQKDIMK
jgi:hypothetical protein